MARFDRLPAIPIITNDPYFSYWVPADKLNEANPIHWTGAIRWIKGSVTIDGVNYRFLSGRGGKKMECKELIVTPTRTISTFVGGGVSLKVTYTSPLLLSDLDVLSTPITYFDYEFVSVDGAEHEAKLIDILPATMCYDGQSYKEVEFKDESTNGLSIMTMGQKVQNPLNHSADQITIDWGYLYVASAEGELKPDTEDTTRYIAIRHLDTFKIGAEPVKKTVLVGYDDIYSINYFGYKAKAWFARNGKTVKEAIIEFAERHDEIIEKCEKFDAELLAEAEEKGGEDYRLIVVAGYRQAIAAHKLIADEEGKMVFLSKENDSNGCIGTVDVSYPSIPLFLKYAPELVNALCRHIFKFADLPIWTFDYAPHDVGRYPYATGQVYALIRKLPNGVVVPNIYEYPAEKSDIYTEKTQMPVEECGNMLIMLETAVEYGASDELIRANIDTLDMWVKYLETYGEDPGDQLCTDDFAGHLARNINLSAKAFIGMECYSKILARLGREDADAWDEKARKMAASWLERASSPAGGSYLTFDKTGWSMKYNLAWDKILDLKMLPDEFYRKEIKSYLPNINEFGLPLDSRETYTKSDWTIWVASMADETEDFLKLIAPVAKFLRESATRLPFSDWYDTTDGRFIGFIARSVQGGLFMPLIKK